MTFYLIIHYLKEQLSFNNIRTAFLPEICHVTWNKVCRYDTSTVFLSLLQPDSCGKHTPNTNLTFLLTFALCGLAGKGQDLLAEVLPLFIAQVGIAGEQSARLQVSTHAVKENTRKHRNLTSLLTAGNNVILLPESVISPLLVHSKTRNRVGLWLYKC